MKLVFLTNIVNHHQICVADKLFEILGDNYKYVAFEALPHWLRQGGYSDIERPYILRAYEDDLKYKKAVALANCAEVVIIGSAPEKLVRQRLLENKITFHYSERWFKQKLGLRVLSPRMWYNILMNHWRFNNKRSYMLCASAYTAYDVNMVGTYKNKCFKWGYFPVVKKLDVDKILYSRPSKVIKLMWCARFLKLKHPELPVYLAARLKNQGYDFVIDMYGSGEELENTMELAKQLEVVDVVKFRGNFPNDKILKEMQEHHIFLFTSDRNEGWGAVLNEAMANASTVVASNEIGSVPYLIKDGVNGLIFESQNIDSLVEKVELILEDTMLRNRLAREAYRTISSEWSPENAAESLLKLISGLQTCPSFRFEGYGPCSIAEIIKG